MKRRAIALAMCGAWALGPTAVAGTEDACPVELLGGRAEANGISIVFRNNSSKTIRELHFGCKLADAVRDRADRWRCYETGARFLPGVEYAVKYLVEGGVPGPVIVSLKSVVFSDGQKWKASKQSECEPIKILPAVNGPAAKSEWPTFGKVSTGR